MVTIQDFKSAFHSLSKAKGYVFTIVFTLGITLGALVAIFNLNYQILAAPLPYPDADRLVVFKSQQYEKGKPTNIQASPYPLVIETYRQKDELFSQKALLSYTVSIERRWPGSPVLNTISTTPNYFSMLGASMAKGRAFSEDEDLDSMRPVAVISYDTWQDYFQLDPDVIGKTLNIMEIEFTIVGVLDEQFVEPELLNLGWKTQVWLPMDYDDVATPTRKNWRASVGRTFVIGKLENGVNRSFAENQINPQSARRFEEEMQAINDNPDLKLSVSLVSFYDAIKGNSSKQILLMLMGVLVLVLISAANIINLVLARATQQQRSMAIQLALGAQKKHLFNSILAELICLMLGATFFSLIVSAVILRFIEVAAEGLLPRLDELKIDGLTLLFALMVSFLLALIFAWLVGRQIDMRRLNGLLQSSGKGVGLQISKSMRQFLILIQITLTGILLSVSLQIFFHTAQQLQQDIGYHTENQYQVRISVATLWNSTTKEERVAYFNEMVELLRKNQKIEAVGLSSGAPVAVSSPRFRNVVLEPGAENKIPMIETWGNGSFLNMMKMPLVAGRYFTDEEAKANENKLVINETLAKLIDPQADVIGKFVYRDGESFALEIVGIVQDLQIPAGQRNPREEPRAFRSNLYEESEILIRVKSGQTLSSTEVNSYTEKVHPGLKVAYLKSTDELLSNFTHAQKTITGLTAGLSILVLLLTTIGIYGILSYSVQVRRFELGVRMAIGARPVVIFLQIMKDNLIPVIAGLLISLMVLLGLSIWIQQTSFYLSHNLLGWFLPLLLILVITVATTFLSVRNIIRNPSNAVLRGD